MMKTVPAWFAVLLLVAPVCHAIPFTYSFFQDGYTDGAFVSGTFTVQDLNGDGVFAGANVVGPAETLSYSASFSGNSIVPAFGTVSGLGIFSFLYNPATNDFFMSGESPIPGLFRDIRIDDNLGSVTWSANMSPPFLSDSSTAPVVFNLVAVNGVQVVPDSAKTLTLLAFSMVGLIALQHAHRSILLTATNRI